MDVEREAREWWEKNRDNFVTGTTGTGFSTRAEYDIPAMLVAHAAFYTRRVRAQALRDACGFTGDENLAAWLRRRADEEEAGNV